VSLARSLRRGDDVLSRWRYPQEPHWRSRPKPPYELYGCCWREPHEFPPHEFPPQEFPPQEFPHCAFAGSKSAKMTRAMGAARTRTQAAAHLQHPSTTLRPRLTLDSPGLPSPRLHNTKGPLVSPTRPRCRVDPIPVESKPLARQVHNPKPQSRERLRHHSTELEFFRGRRSAWHVKFRQWPDSLFRRAIPRPSVAAACLRQTAQIGARLTLVPFYELSCWHRPKRDGHHSVAAGDMQLCWRSGRPPNLSPLRAPTG
jgi:hypothetical protein